MNRKLRKLLKSPHEFARDMVANRVADVSRRLPRTGRRRGSRRYTVIAAVYGVEKYLDDFFRSMVRQSLHFETHVELVMVDDGSPDRSAEIIAAWQAKYPRSIRYVRKENGGQASARNVGLEHATGDWIAFVDPDDFVDETYFERVDELLDRPESAELALVSCNFLVYHESRGRPRDTHPLSYRFAAGDRVVRASELSTDVQLSVNSALFRRDLLQGMALRFDEAIRPSFEDAHFAGRYLLGVREHDVAFATGPKYYYRKRADESSTLDRAWTKPSLYDEVLDRGCRDLFRRAKAESDTGTVPVWLQRTVLYHLIWYFKRLVDNADAIAFLSDDQTRRFQMLLRELLADIDVQTILDFDLGGARLHHKIGILGLFKNAAPDFLHVYVEQYDEAKELLQLRYFQRADEVEAFTVDQQEVFPAFAKVRRHDFLGETFANERIVWLPVRGLSGTLRAAIGDARTILFYRGKAHREGVGLRELVRKRRPPRPSSLPLDLRATYLAANTAIAKRTYRDAFVLMDRDTQADDNAEHLYRYIAKHRPDINAFFVLRRSSHDWARLEREGFRLLAFGSLAHRLALLNAKHLISSHADHYVLDYPSGKHLEDIRKRRRFTFLQHGVTHNDLSAWFNTKDFDCFVTTSPAEHEALIASGGPYKLTEREVVFSGFPRHDALGAGATEPERILMIMPTWRRSLVGAALGAGNDRALNPAFYDSEYARTWKALLHSDALRRIADEHGYRVQFFPHANIQPYLDWFAPPPHVETVSHAADRSIQQVLRSASIVLTDYSSIVFEVAYLRRAVLYYQFDRAHVFSGGHLTRKGYFDFERDGFGPVCLDESALIDALSGLMARGGAPAPEHLARMERTFPLRDGRNCERTLEAILDLDRPVHASDRSDVLLVEAARSATTHRAWSLAERRWARVLELPSTARPDDAELRLLEAKRELGKYDEVDASLVALEARGVPALEIDRERAELATAAQHWQRAAALWTERARARIPEAERTRAWLRVAEAHRRDGALERAAQALDAIGLDVEPVAMRVERAELASARARWAESAERWAALASEQSLSNYARLRLAEALARAGEHDRALEAIDACLATGAASHERSARALRLALSIALRERERMKLEGARDRSAD